MVGSQTSYDATASCPEGYTVSGESCVADKSAAVIRTAKAEPFPEPTYSCPDGGSLGFGNKCHIEHPVDNGTAIGANSSVQHDHSTAIGAGSSSTADHQVTLGTGEDTVRAPGITSQTSKDRQSGPLEFVTTDADGNLASDGGAMAHWASATDGRLATHDMLLKSYGDKLKDHAKGLAIAAAMPDAWLSDSKNFGVFASFGGFDGETALGVAAIGRLSRSFSINAKIGTDTGFEHVGYQVGAGWQF
jgi:hypothetical protein